MKNDIRISYELNIILYMLFLYLHPRLIIIIVVTCLPIIIHINFQSISIPYYDEYDDTLVIHYLIIEAPDGILVHS